jgi:hypothetical protein
MFVYRIITTNFMLYIINNILKTMKKKRFNVPTHQGCRIRKAHQSESSMFLHIKVVEYAKRINRKVQCSDTSRLSNTQSASIGKFFQKLINIGASEHYRLDSFFNQNTPADILIIFASQCEQVDHS